MVRYYWKKYKIKKAKKEAARKKKLEDAKNKKKKGFRKVESTAAATISAVSAKLPVKGPEGRRHTVV